MYKVDLILTLWDRSFGHIFYNRQIIPLVLQFINYPVNVIVQFDRPSPENYNHFKNLLENGVINKLTIPEPVSNHMPHNINYIFLQAFRHIESPWVIHFDGDMFFYRNGYGDWLPHFIRIIESRYRNIGAISHTMPYNHYNPIKKRFEPRKQSIQWVSTRFFLTEAETVLEAMDDSLRERDINFEGVMWQKRLFRLGLNCYTLPFNPDFLVVHINGLHQWTDNRWKEYENAVKNRNEILLKNISHSDWGDIAGNGEDIHVQEYWGHGTWQTEGNEGEMINLLEVYK